MFPPYRCVFCKQYLHSFDQLRKHVKLHRMKYSVSRFLNRNLYTDSKIFHHRRHVQDSQCDRTVLRARQQRSNTCTVRRQSKRFVLRLYPCEECNEYLPGIVALTIHDTLAHEKGPRQCVVCKRDFSIKALKNHYLSDACTAKARTEFYEFYTCKLCNKRFNHFHALLRHTNRCNQLGSLNVHVKTHTKEKPLHTNVKPFQCRTCSQCFKGSKSLKAHIKTHTKEKPLHTKVKPFQCRTCSQCFKRSKSLKAHIKTHTKEKLLHTNGTCSHCFNQFESLHTYAKPYQCTRVNESQAADTQVVPNNGNIQYQCGTCNQRFEQLDSYCSHIGTHTKEKPLHTNVKPYQCTRPNELQTQVIPQNESVQFQCGICNDCFDQFESLEAHFGTHAKKKPSVKFYQCKVCTMRFTQLDILDTHIKQCHKNLDKGVELREDTSCKKSSDSSDEVSAHMKTHKHLKNPNEMKPTKEKPSKEKPFQCSFKSCKKRFDSSDEVGAHVKTHKHPANPNATKQEKPYQCPVCKKFFTNIKRHIARHVQTEPPFQCELCKQCFPQSNDLKPHILKHLNQKPFQCETCNERFIRWTAFKAHTRKHTEHRCNTCKKRFSELSDLKLHIMTHAKEKPYQCEKCNKCFADQYRMDMHVTIVHRTHKCTVPRSFQCETCGICFSHVSTLKSHVRSHTNEKPYQCEKCGLCVTSSRVLKRHIRNMHTNKKSFQCKECKTCFTDADTYYTHIAAHDAKKPHKCHICWKRFALIYQVKSHMVIHTRELRFECDICKRKFCRKGGLKHHRVRVHKRKPEEAII